MQRKVIAARQRRHSKEVYRARRRSNPVRENSPAPLESACRLCFAITVIFTSRRRKRSWRSTSTLSGGRK